MCKKSVEISTWLAAMTVVLSRVARFARSRCPTHGGDVQCADIEVSWSTWRVGWLDGWESGVEIQSGHVFHVS